MNSYISMSELSYIPMLAFTSLIVNTFFNVSLLFLLKVFVSCGNIQIRKAGITYDDTERKAIER